MKTRMIAAVLILGLSACLPLAAQEEYTNSNGHIVYAPTINEIPGQANLRCRDGWFSHSEHTQGACSYHGGLAATGTIENGGGGECGTGCKAAVAGVAVGTGIGIAIAVHHQRVVRKQIYCQQHTGDVRCQQYLFDHPVNGIPYMTPSEMLTAQTVCGNDPKAKYVVVDPGKPDKHAIYYCKRYTQQW